MTLVAPSRPTRPEPPATEPSAVAPPAVELPATPARVPAGGGTGREVLALLRGDSAARPHFDPALAGGLRAWLEDAAYDVVDRRGDDAAPLVLGPHQVLGGTRVDVERHAPDPAADATVDAGLLAQLVHALFRQQVHAGALADPLADALDALRADGRTETVAQIESAAPGVREGLASRLDHHAANLGTMVPRFAPGWMPRTDDRVAIPLAGGRVVLRGTFDLLVGFPRPGAASLCALGLSTGGAWVRARRALHYLALLETLRRGAPPFRLALLDSATGRYGVEDVREEHLRALASHLAAVLAELASGADGPVGAPRAAHG